MCNAKHRPVYPCKVVNVSQEYWHGSFQTMKLAYAVCFLYLWIVAVTGAWLDIPSLSFQVRQLSEIFRDPIADSLISTLIPDTDHPWLSKNRRWLESWPDVASAICDKSSPHLERLGWGLDAKDTMVFGEEFVRQNLTLLDVRHLVPGAQSHYLIPMCPSPETLEAGGFFYHASWKSGNRRNGDSMLQLVRSASSVSSLKELSMLDSDWTSEKLEGNIMYLVHALKRG
ncbi:hypothetical protein K449DRAFT_150361 [Hypoxylon sp. EC38]|nr:hypothetical protein K449DRAFT_150361 [Hypoxylon sp. EC38]